VRSNRAPRGHNGGSAGKGPWPRAYRSQPGTGRYNALWSELIGGLVLLYGTYWEAHWLAAGSGYARTATFTCNSAVTGVRCRTSEGHGFFFFVSVQLVYTW
jgi:hypothetical protein